MAEDKNRESSIILSTQTHLARVGSTIDITNKIIKEIEERRTPSPIQTFEEVVIGGQVWMLKNLNVEKFRNGEIIPHANTYEEWRRAGENCMPAWCYYDNAPDNGVKYGKLYNWFAVNDSRSLAPDGWYIPNEKEYDILIDNLGGFKVAGLKMKSKSIWQNSDKGTNESGFSGLPSGCAFISGKI